ncbi:hypothetical protein [Microbacterium sorbitolivorans]|uniref:hypothetical protein n=1 Tax=Microbacterium sorbitolivorans TaxID=1867410 RepID=UPI0013B04B33|nr:hypothetical protein [Microbacterium sorbitolivorans]
MSMLLVYLSTAERFRTHDLAPVLIGPLFVKPSDWLLGGFLVAIACFIATPIMRARSASVAPDRQQRGGPALLGRVLLHVASTAIMLVALFYLVVALAFPVSFERLTPGSENGCTVVVENRDGMASKSGHLFLIPAQSHRLIDTEQHWYYDDPMFADGEWSITWAGDTAIVVAPDDSVSFNSKGNSTTRITCE